MPAPPSLVADISEPSVAGERVTPGGPSPGPRAAWVRLGAAQLAPESVVEGLGAELRALENQGLVLNRGGSGTVAPGFVPALK